MTPTERSLRARIGGFALAAQRNPQEYTVAARRAFFAKFEREVDPAGALPPTERQRRAEAARRAYFLKLALKSAIARRKKKSGPKKRI